MRDSNRRRTFAGAAFFAGALGASGGTLAAPEGLEECALRALGAPIAEQATSAVLDPSWAWARLRPAVAADADLPGGPARRVPPLPLLDAAALLVEWAGQPLARVLASPQAHGRVLSAPLVVAGTLAARLDALAAAVGSDVVLAYDAAGGVLHAHVPPLLVLRAAPGPSRLASAALLRGAGATGVRVPSPDGALWASASPEVLERAAPRLSRVEAAPVAAVLDLRLVRLRAASADTVWGQLRSLATELHYRAGGGEVLGWPVLVRHRAALARDALLSGAAVHTVRRVLVLADHLTALPFDPSRPCASRSPRGTGASLAMLGFTVSDVSGRSPYLDVAVLGAGTDAPLARFAAAEPYRVALVPGAVFALREGLDVAFAQYRPVGTARLASEAQ